MLDIMEVWLGTIAWLTSVLALGASVYFDARPDVEHAIGTVGGLAAAFMWFIFAFGATAIQTPSGGQLLDGNSESLALFGLGLGLFMVAVAFMDTAWMLNVFDIKEDGIQ